MPTTIAQMMSAADGRPSGFDYSRITLAFAVILFHSVQYSYVDGADIAFSSWARSFFKFIVPMFFCLSGFLVAGSAIRSKTLIKFAGLRVIRIYPALIVEVIVSALIIGPLLTKVPLNEYFSTRSFWRYLFNITGHISYFLPGMFASNPLPYFVNSQLWTIKFELLCYISISILILLGKKRFNWTIPCALALITAYIIEEKFRLHTFLTMGSFETGEYLVMHFLFGVLLFNLKGIIPYSKALFWICLASAFVLTGYVPSGDLLSLYPLCYVTVFLGVSNPRRVGLLKVADLSYGVYLYGAVLQQAIIQIFPWSHEWYTVFILTILPVFVVAGTSWILVEKPAMGLRKYVEALETMWLKRRALHDHSASQERNAKTVG